MSDETNQDAEITDSSGSKGKTVNNAMDGTPTVKFAMPTKHEVRTMRHRGEHARAALARRIVVWKQRYAEKQRQLEVAEAELRVYEEVLAIINAGECECEYQMNPS